MTQVRNWFSQFQGWAHWFAGVALSAALLYGTNDAVQKAVNSALAGAPKLAGFLAAASSILLAYANSKHSSQQSAVSNQPRTPQITKDTKDHKG
jgi:hypothetical protein